MELKLLLLVAVGGALGAVLRYLLQSIVEPENTPYATLGINLLGSLLLGAMFGAMAAGVVLNEGTVLLLGMGVLGSFTTMSTFAMQAVDYTQHSHTSSALYVLMTVGGSILLAWSGYRAALVLIS